MGQFLWSAAENANNADTSARYHGESSGSPDEQGHGKEQRNQTKGNEFCLGSSEKKNMVLYGFNMCNNLALEGTVIFKVSRRFCIRKNSMRNSVLLKIWKKI